MAKHPELVRLPIATIEQGIALPIDSFVKALTGAVARGVLTTEEACEIIEDASLHITEGVALIGK